MDLTALMDLAAQNKALLASVAGSAAGGYVAAMVVPPAEMAVKAFRLAVKFPLVRMAVKRNPAAVKAMLNEVEEALDREIDSLAKEDAPAPAAPKELPKP